MINTFTLGAPSITVLDGLADDTWGVNEEMGKNLTLLTRNETRKPEILGFNLVDDTNRMPQQLISGDRDWS